MNLPDPPLLLITDRSQTARPLTDIVAAAFDGGCRWLMLREKDIDTEERRALLTELLHRALAYQATVTVNGDIDAALAAGAHGVHLPQGNADVAAAREKLGAGALIGVSAHDLAEAKAAAGADYVTLSPVFVSPSKPDYGPQLTPGGFGKLARAIPLPAIGLGGIEPGNAGEIAVAGGVGIAVMGSVMRAGDPAREVERLLAAWRSGARYCRSPPTGLER